MGSERCRYGYQHAGEECAYCERDRLVRELEDAEGRAAHLRAELAKVTIDCAIQMARAYRSEVNREAWREYAYGRGDRPGDAADSPPSDTQTEITRLRTELEKYQQRLEQMIANAGSQFERAEDAERRVEELKRALDDAGIEAFNLQCETMNRADDAEARLRAVVERLVEIQDDIGPLTGEEFDDIMQAAHYVRCETCGGSGSIYRDADPALGFMRCPDCHGLGWRAKKKGDIE